MPQPIVKSTVLPNCPLKTLRAYLDSKGFSKLESMCTYTHEFWATQDSFNTVRFPIDEDPMDYCNVSAITEIQLRKGLYDIPFYAKHIAQRFSEG